MKNNIQHKRVFLIWLAIYPLITLIFFLFGEYLIKLPLLLRTLLLTGCIVPSMAYIILPFYNRIFAKWLNK